MLFEENAETAPTWADEVDGLVRALRAAFAASPAPRCPLASYGRLSPEQEAKWLRIQASVPAASVAALDIACLLAYLGVDYTVNAGHVLLASRPLDRLVQRAGRINRVCAASHLARLYDKWHDSALLAGLLDGDFDNRTRSEALLALWDRHWPSVLRAASKSELRCRRAARALRTIGAQFDGQSIRRACLAYIRRGSRSSDPVLRSTSIRILRLAHCGRARPGFHGRP